MALTDKQILAYLSIKGLGTKTGFHLAEQAMKKNITLQSPQEMFDFFQVLLRQKIISRCKIEDINPIIDGLDLAERIIERSAEQGIKYTTYYSNDYPSKLKSIVNAKGDCDAPLILWYKGDLSIAEMPSVAIIGTREPTPEGITAGNYIGQKFAEAGFNIVSGLAYGCDKSGHVGALKAANGKTTAFLAHGLDSVYPPEHKELAAEIVHRGGLLMSEYPIGTRGMANFFIARDRLQSGLSDACIVVQTGRTGGTLHAVHSTVANGKPLYAVTYKDQSVMQMPKVLGNVMMLEEGVEEGGRFSKALPLACAGIDQVIADIRNAKPSVQNVQHTPVQGSLFD